MTKLAFTSVHMHIKRARTQREISMPGLVVGYAAHRSLFVVDEPADSAPSSQVARAAVVAV
jgi:hypothetical protein